MIIYKKTLLVFFVIIILFIEIIFSEIVPFLKYTDEIVAVISILCIVTWFLHNGGRKIDKEYRKILLLICAISILGFVGNYINKLCPSSFAAAVDCLGTIKALVLFIFVYSYLDSITATQVVKLLYKPAKLFLWLAVFFGIISIFTDIGMSGEVRFGLGAYSFIFKHAHILAIVSICALAIIGAIEVVPRKIYFYTLLTCICQFLTTKGPSIIWCIMIFTMFRYYIHNRKIKPWLIVFMVIVGVTVGGYQITNYFMNDTAPRALLLKYGIQTANRYFPLGSGFATYGSEMAKVYYSKLYYQYGFNAVWGMGKYDGRFLNDNYWPMVIGQIGYFGGVLFAYIYFIIFRSMQKKCSDRIERAILITNYLYILIHSLGSASLTSMEGTFLFAIFGVVTALYKCNCTSKIEV